MHKKTQSGNWVNKWDVTPNDKTKMSSPLTQNNLGNMWGCYTQRQNKSDAKPPS